MIKKVDQNKKYNFISFCLISMMRHVTVESYEEDLLGYLYKFEETFILSFSINIK